MLLIRCPYCEEERPELEFRNAGEAHVARSRDIAGISDDDFAHTIASDDPHPINAPFTLERFRTGRLIDEAAAAAVAH